MSFLTGLPKGISYPNEKLKQETELQGMGNITQKEVKRVSRKPVKAQPRAPADPERTKQKQ